MGTAVFLITVKSLYLSNGLSFCRETDRLNGDWGVW